MNALALTERVKVVKLVVVVKASIHPRKLLCIWWDKKGVVCYELLPRNVTNIVEVYCH